VSESTEVTEVTVTTAASEVLRATFSIPLIIGASNRFSNGDKLRRYDPDISALEADGFLSTDPEHKAFTRMISNVRKPSAIIVAQATNRPTQRWKVTPIAENGAKYELEVGSAAIAPYTADGSATVAEITAALKTAVDALATGATTTDAGTHLHIVTSGPGVFLRVRVPPTSRKRLLIEQDHADPGIAADLTAFEEKASESEGALSFYGIHLCFPSTATILAAAAWVETKTTYLLSVATANSNTTTGAVGNISALIETLAYRRTAIFYHHDPAEFADAGRLGRCLPLEAGTETWQMKTLVGVTPSVLDAGERAQLQATNTSYYVRYKGKNVTLGGAKVADGHYIDTIRAIDELVARIAEDVFQIQVDRDQAIPQDDGGIAIMARAVQSRLERSVGKLLRADPAPTTTAPLASDLTETQRNEREVPIGFAGYIRGAVHKTKVTGTVV
jgi:hypothetical protein